MSSKPSQPTSVKPDWKTARRNDESRFKDQVRDSMIGNIDTELTEARNALIGQGKKAQDPANLSRWFAYATIGKRHEVTAQLAGQVLNRLEERLDIVLKYLKRALNDLVRALPLRERSLSDLAQAAKRLADQIEVIQGNVTRDDFKTLKADADFLKVQYDQLANHYDKACEALRGLLDGTAIAPAAEGIAEGWNFGPVEAELNDMEQVTGEIRNNFLNVIPQQIRYESFEFAVFRALEQQLSERLIGSRGIRSQINQVIDWIKDLRSVTSTLSKRADRYQQIVDTLSAIITSVKTVREKLALSDQLKAILQPGNFIIPSHFLVTQDQTLYLTMPLQGVETHLQAFDELAQKAKAWLQWLNELKAAYHDAFRTGEWEQIGVWERYVEALLQRHEAGWRLWHTWYELRPYYADGDVPETDQPLYIQFMPEDTVALQRWLGQLENTIPGEWPARSAEQMQTGELHTFIDGQSPLASRRVGIDREREILARYQLGSRLKTLQTAASARPEFNGTIMSRPETDLIGCFADPGIWDSLKRPDFPDLGNAWLADDNKNPIDEIEAQIKDDLENARRRCAQLHFEIARLSDYARYCQGLSRAALESRSKSERREAPLWDARYQILTNPSGYWARRSNR